MNATTAASRRQSTGVLALALTAALAQTARAQDCPQPLRAVAPLYGEGQPDSPELGVTQFIAQSSAGLLSSAGVKHQVDVVPYARAIKEFESGEASVLIVADSAVAHLRPLAASVPLLRLQVAQYTLADEVTPGRSGWTGILRGFQAPLSMGLEARRLERVASYDSLFRMLAAGRVETVVGVRPTADLYLHHHPEIASRLRPAQSQDLVQMSIHFSRRLPAPCVSLLANVARGAGPELIRSAFASRLPGVHFEDFRLP
jgi:ABC-type amino acid transport substrate-binding protein